MSATAPHYLFICGNRLGRLDLDSLVRTPVPTAMPMDVLVANLQEGQNKTLMNLAFLLGFGAGSRVPRRHGAGARKD